MGQGRREGTAPTTSPLPPRVSGVFRPATRFRRWHFAGSVGLQPPLHAKVCRGCALSETSTGRLRPSTRSRWSSVRSPPDFDLFSTRPLTFAGAYDCLTVLCVFARWLWCAWVRHFLQVLSAR